MTKLDGPSASPGVTQSASTDGPFLRQLLDGAPDGFVVVGPKGSISFANATAERLFGHSQNELLGQPVEMLIPGRFRSQHVLLRSDLSGKPRRRELGERSNLVAIRRDGTEFPVEISLYPVRTIEGSQICAVIRDANGLGRSSIPERFAGNSSLKADEATRNGPPPIGDTPGSAAARGPSSSPPPMGAAPTVVYIEDNQPNVEFMRAALEILEGVELVAMPTAEAGIEFIRSRPPNLVLMDINLPGMNGYEAMKRLQEWPETRGIPVVALTASAMPEDRTRALELGFRAYLRKPVKLDELLETVETLLRAPSSPPSA